MTSVQVQLLRTPQLAEVVQLMESHETSFDTNDTDHVDFEARLSLLETYTTSLAAMLTALNASGVALKYNYSATTAPGVTDDASEGYSVGSIWVNVSTTTGYLCVDETTDAAAWDQLGP